MASPYRLQRGEPIVVPLEAEGAADDDLTFVTSVHAPLKRCVGYPAVPDQSTPVSAQFVATPREAANGIGPGWYLTISADASAALEVGTYAVNVALIGSDGAVLQISEPLFIRIEETTT